MKKTLIFSILIFIILFIGNIIITNYNDYFKYIYLILSLYHFYIFYALLKYERKNIFKIIIFIFFSIIIYYYTYYYICDPNPLFCYLSFYIFYPNVLKANLIVFIHTFFLSWFLRKKRSNPNINIENVPLQNKINFTSTTEQSCCSFYYLSDFINYFFHHKIIFIIFLISLVIFIRFEIFIFLHRIKLWVHYNKKEKTLPIASSKNTTFFIAAMIVNMESTIAHYIKHMKKLIDYLGEQNVIISFIENGDSKDNTRIYLREFQQYLNEKKIVNRFILKHEIDDPRKKVHPYEFISNLRIKFYSQLRNRCLDLLYELPNIDFNNTKVIFFNDVIFEYEDIINLLATNNEDYDAVCGLDFYDIFYDTWVSIDLDGNSLLFRFPYFNNKEGQDLVVNHKPVRVFSCWNGVIVFKADPLKDKKIQFRYKIDPEKEPTYIINNSQQYNYESECTYFHIDLFTLGYTKKFINPDVRVAYKFEHYYQRKYFSPSPLEIESYKEIYTKYQGEERNKLMSNYKDKDIQFNDMVQNWYLENKRPDL